MALRLAGQALAGSWRRGTQLALARTSVLKTTSARCAAGAAASPGEEEALGEPAARPAAPPLSIGSELSLYESSVDLAACAQRARTRCLLGASLGCLGFAGVMVGSAATASVGMQAILGAGAVAYVYKNAILSTRSIAGVALMHVERIVVLPTAPAGAAAPTTEAESDGAPSAEEQLAATPEVHLKIRTANLDMWVKLAEPVSRWDGGRYSGFVSDDRAVIGDLFGEEQRLLHLDEVSGSGDNDEDASSADVALLRAVAASPKVVAERQLELRSDVDGLLRLPSQGIKLAEGLFFPVAKQGQQQQAAGGARRGTPAQEVTALGTQALFSGVIFLLAGALYIGRDMAQDPNNPGRMKDPTVGDLIARIRGGAAGVGAADPSACAAPGQS